MRLVFLGAPGAGKGTLADQVCEKWEIPHISTGDLFRFHLSQKTPLGIEAQSYMDQGKLVPDDLTCRLVEDRLSQEDCQKGFLLDGFPRNVAQAEALKKYLEGRALSLDGVVSIEVPTDLIIQRLSGRRVCVSCGASYNVNGQIPTNSSVCDRCGGSVIQRSDDRPETIAKRLETYQESTFPLVAYYQKTGQKFIQVDNSGDVAESMEQLKRQL